MSDKAADFKKDIVFKVLYEGFILREFTKKDMFKVLDIPWNSPGEQTPHTNKQLIEREFLDKNFIRANTLSGRTRFDQEETLFFLVKPKNNKIKENLYCLTTEAKFKYIDFLELELARKNSVSAKKYSQISIYIAIGALVVSAIGSFAQVISLSFIK